ncbi:hypothetical protein ACGF0D_26330 [Kitasatospora sp. NPDC048298]|uniref:hypothetical protein n=1 Tax=Kitasatospora sp. NPDC048298 TaxID=3364049 RepID=UPI003713B2DE
MAADTDNGTGAGSYLSGGDGGVGADPAGVAVARTDSGGRVQVQWIFDRADYTFLGEHTVALTDGTTVRKGDVTGQMAVLTRAIVSRSGTRP